MNKNLTHIPTKKQLIWGWIYLGVDTIVLPFLIALAIIALRSIIPFSITEGQYNGIYFSINFIVVMLIFHKFLFQEICRCKGRIGQLLKTAGLGFLIYMTVNFFVGVIIASLNPGFTNVNDSAIAEMVASDYWILAIGTTLLVPVTEELLFRGVLFAGLYNRSKIAAYAVSALLFSAVHVVGYIGQYPAATLLLCLVQYVTPSLCLCWTYAKADSILVPVLIHTVINTLGILSMR